MESAQKTPILDAAQHTPMENNAIKQAGGEVHHEENETERITQELHSHTPEQNVVQPHQFEEQKGQAQKRSFMDSVVDFLTFKWYKTNLRNRYGEDINKVRAVREAEREQHAAKPRPEPYKVPTTPPQQNASVSAAPHVTNAPTQNIPAPQSQNVENVSQAATVQEMQQTETSVPAVDKAQSQDPQVTFKN